MKTILCYGDSNTNGCNPKCDIRDWLHPEPVPVRYERKYRWTGILQEELGKDYYVIEEGLPGRTFMYEDNILPYRKGQDYIRPCMWSHNPIDLLVIMLGTNDAKALYGASEYLLAVGIEEFLKIVKDPALWEGNKVGKILLVAPPPIGDNIKESPYYGMFDERSVELSKKFSELYKAIAEVNGCEYLDAGEFIESGREDALHFSLEDHQKLAKGMADKILSLNVTIQNP